MCVCVCVCVCPSNLVKKTQLLDDGISGSPHIELQLNGHKVADLTSGVFSAVVKVRFYIWLSLACMFTCIFSVLVVAITF